MYATFIKVIFCDVKYQYGGRAKFSCSFQFGSDN
jgi:hypothetical protein